MAYSIGDLVRIKDIEGEGAPNTWPDSVGKTGVIVKFAKRLFIPAAKVFVLGEIAEFDLDELEVIIENS